MRCGRAVQPVRIPSFVGYGQCERGPRLIVEVPRGRLGTGRRKAHRGDEILAQSYGQALTSLILSPRVPSQLVGGPSAASAGVCRRARRRQTLREGKAQFSPSIML